MPYYLIHERLDECCREDVHGADAQFVAVLTHAEFAEVRELFDKKIDIEMDLKHIHETKAVVNINSLTGTFNIPDHENYSGHKFKIAFVMDEKGIVFIDDSDYTHQIMERIHDTKKWKLPSLERLIYDFLEETIRHDISLLEKTEQDLDIMERSIMKGEIEQYPIQLNDIRSDLLDMHMHYEHLLDVAKEFEENENDFFDDNNVRYFRLFQERVTRLEDNVDNLRDLIVQLRDLVSEQLSIKQNNIMTLLTVITTIFMPLTLIAGWYGMNFVNMPELYMAWGYPIVIIVSLMIVVCCLVFFKKKKWM